VLEELSGFAVASMSSTWPFILVYIRPGLQSARVSNRPQVSCRCSPDTPPSATVLSALRMVVRGAWVTFPSDQIRGAPHHG